MFVKMLGYVHVYIFHIYIGTCAYNVIFTHFWSCT